MKNKTRIIAFVLILAFAVSFSGCSLVQVDEAKDRARVIATVDGTDITKGEVMDRVAASAYASGYAEDYFENEDNAEELKYAKESALTALILDIVETNKAAELGLDTFTDEEIADIEASVAEFTDYTKAQIEYQVVSENEALGLTVEDEEVNAEIDRRFEELLGNYSIEVDELLEHFIHTEVILRLQDSIFEDVDVTEQEVRDYYDLNLESQESAATENPEMMALFEQLGSIIVYRDKPTHYIRHILIELDDEDQSLSYDASTQFSAATTDEEKEAAMAILEPAFQKIEEKVALIQTKIDEGEDFDALIEALGDDPGMASYPDGYPVVAGSGEYVESFETAAFELTNIGDISGPVKSFFGVHFLKLVGIDPIGPIPFEDVQYEIEQTLLSNAQSSAWSTATEEWKSEAEIEEFTDKLY